VAVHTLGDMFAKSLDQTLSHANQQPPWQHDASC
jgi:hypothetical protein